MKKGATILCYGDSNTFGYDPRGRLGSRYPANHRWVDLLSEYGYTGINEGQNGREFPTDRIGYGHLQKILERNLEADVLVIMLGANDVERVYPPSENAIAKRAEDMFAAVPLLSSFKESGKKILMIASPPMTQMAVGREDLLGVSKRLAKALEKVSEKEGIAFCDAGTWDVELAFDGDHFTEKGHATFAQKLAEVLDQMDDVS